MPDDRGSRGIEPTLTPTQAIGEAATSAGSLARPAAPSTGALPARYAAGQRIGAGGMGEVLLASDQQIGRDVAIKRMRVEPTESSVARFMREARVQGRLDHPAIVPVHELGTDDAGRPYFVMKRLTGRTLAEILEGGAAARQRLLRAFADVCLAIEFAHSRGVVHRDLKPDNIMLGDFGEVYVLDWGVAHLQGTEELPHDGATVSAEGTTEAGAILGTPGYIAPELLRGEPLDGRADVYALGCILFELLAGVSLLPRGRAALEAAERDVDARPSVRAPDREVPPELDAICVAATARQRDARPTAREVADRIQDYLDGDRDLAQRKQLAAEHLAAAVAALDSGDGEHARATAMREAGRAIALDPRDNSAAELVGRLMLEPPLEIPAEVEARVTAVEEATARSKIRLMETVLLSFLLFVPGLLYMGIRSWTALAVFVGATLANLAVTLHISRRGRPSAASIYVAAAIYGVLVALLGRLFSPFLIAPAIAAVSVMMFVVDPRIRWAPITFGYVAVVLVPWLLEMIGAVPRTMFASEGELHLRSDVVSIALPEAEIALAFFVLTLITLVGYVASRLGVAQRDAVRSTELQAWHLRQLVRH